MLTRTQAIKNYLEAQTWADLAELYNHDMEVQVLAAQDNGERESRSYNGHSYECYCDPVSGEEWKSLRIPYDGDTNPHYDEDPAMTFDLAKHTEGIGLSGYDWKNRVTRWVAYDFDSVKDHIKGIPQDQLAEIDQRVSNHPNVTLRYSTRGAGRHIYIALKTAVPTKNRIEHRALARAILSWLSATVGYNFELAVDQLGGNMWVFHRKMHLSNGVGLKLIKAGEPLEAPPLNWKDHIGVCSGKYKKSKPFFIAQSDEEEKLFEQLIGRRSSIQLDQDHQKIIDWLISRGCAGQWYSDRNMAVTHTSLLKECHQALGLRGFFETSSTGSDYGRDINCFMFPIKDGGFVVRRYTPGTPEHESWDVDNQGYTRCFLNRNPDLVSASRTYGGQEKTSGGFVFKDPLKAAAALLALGETVQFPKAVKDREIVIKKHSKDNRLVLTVKKEEGDSRDPEFADWTPEHGVWSKIFSRNVSRPTEVQSDDYDSLLRHLITEGKENSGWAICVQDEWNFEPLEHIRKVLVAQAMTSKEADEVLGSIVLRPFTMVNEPFEAEWPSEGRKWNRFGAQLRFVPSNEETLHYPTFMKILKHCGKSLDSDVKNSAWCRLHSITEGWQYLFAWVASVFNHPKKHLPYLFLFGPQNSGKTSFHEMLTRLLAKGYCRADRALTSQAGFNAELQYALLCVIEETDLRRNKMAADRIKDWVTAQELSIHAKGKTPYNLKNYTKWIQCSNDSQACPVFTGDTRVTMIFVDNLEPAELIPKERLLNQLDKEAADFLAALKRYQQPEADGRLNVTVLETSSKEQLQAKNLDPVEMFLSEVCHYVPGEVISYGEIYKIFVEWLEPNERLQWSKTKFGKELPDKYPKGILSNSSQFHVGNLSLTNVKPTKTKLILINKKLVHQHG